MDDLSTYHGYEPFMNLRKRLNREFNQYDIDAGSTIIVFKNIESRSRRDDYYVVSSRGALLKIECDYPCNLKSFHPRTILNNQNAPLGWIVDKRKEVFYLGNCLKKRRHLDRLLQKAIPTHT